MKRRPCWSCGRWIIYPDVSNFFCSRQPDLRCRRSLPPVITGKFPSATQAAGNRNLPDRWPREWKLSISLTRLKLRGKLKEHEKWFIALRSRSRSKSSEIFSSFTLTAYRWWFIVSINECLDGWCFLSLTVNPIETFINRIIFGYSSYILGVFAYLNQPEQQSVDPELSFESKLN